MDKETTNNYDHDDAKTRDDTLLEGKASVCHVVPRRRSNLPLRLIMKVTVQVNFVQSMMVQGSLNNSKIIHKLSHSKDSLSSKKTLWLVTQTAMRWQRPPPPSTSTGYVSAFSKDYVILRILDKINVQTITTTNLMQLLQELEQVPRLRMLLL